MSETARERANREQLAASDPAISAFVAASAGSGKTKLLTRPAASVDAGRRAA